MSKQIGVAAIAFLGSNFLSCEKPQEEGAPIPVLNQELDNSLKNHDSINIDLRHVGQGSTDSKLPPYGVPLSDSQLAQGVVPMPNFEKMFETLSEIDLTLAEIKCMVRHRAIQVGVDLDDLDSNKPN